MPRRKRRKRQRKYKPPAFEDRVQTDHVHTENDYLLKSRLGYWVDTSQEPLSADIVDDKRKAKVKWDSNKNDYGNSDIVRFPVVKDSEKY